MVRWLWARNCGGFRWEKTWHDSQMRTSRQLADTYRFSGFRLRAAVRGILGDPKAGHLPSAPREKTLCGVCGGESRVFYDHKVRHIRVSPAAILGFIWRSHADECSARTAAT